MPMRIQFYEDPIQEPRVREEVQFNQIGLYMYEDGRRFMVGFDLTPFIDLPSIQVFAEDESGKEVASMTIIETFQSNFNLTMHLPEDAEQDRYDVSAILYYQTHAGGKKIVDQISKKLDTSKPGEQ